MSSNFDQMAKLIKKKRAEKKLSQGQLSFKLGYKNGQFISNVERGLCGIPAKKASTLCKILGIDKPSYIAVAGADYIEGLRLEMR